MIGFTLPEDGFVSVQIQAADGRAVRTLVTAQAFPKGGHEVAWDGLDDARQPVPPGDYRWSGVVHDGIRAKLRGWACAGNGTPWATDDPHSRWGGDGGVPGAVAADAERVYLGWSGAVLGHTLLACDLEGGVLWAWRGSQSTGVKALAVDDGVLHVLGDEGGELSKLDARDGRPRAWAHGDRLRIAGLWPADAKTKPAHADAMTARAGRIYLSFTEAQFLAVLDAQTGAYLQTVVGAAPELIDVVPTKTESETGELMAADFALVSLRGGVLGKVLFAHDPLWVIASDMQPLDREERITALSVIGDGAPQHSHSAFVGLGAPFHQVQRRSVLNTEGFLWSAGRLGGRVPGPWVPEALGPIRGVALDARGRLWVAEGDAAPPRFSVWSTDGTEGRLVREFFGPVRHGSRVVVSRDDPEVMTGAGCQWRVDPATGLAQCLAVEPLAGEAPAAVVTDLCGEATAPAGRLRFLARESFVEVVNDAALVVARLFEAPVEALPAQAAPGLDVTRWKLDAAPTFTQTADGRVFAGVADVGICNVEITGIGTVRALGGGVLRVKTRREQADSQR